MEKRRICCFCEIWAGGGIESYLAGLLGELDPESVEVDIVAARLEESVFTEALRRRGVRFSSSPEVPAISRATTGCSVNFCKSGALTRSI